MKNSPRFFVFLLVSLLVVKFSNAQGPSCPNNIVYIHNGNQILAQPVPMGSGPQTTVMSNLPAGSGGLAIGPNFAGIGPNPTYWTTSGGTYWYFNGVNWTNTGHSSGNGAAVNLGGGGNFIYNLVGGTGQVYVYNGSGNGTLLFTIPNFNGGGPYDIVCDVNGNIYIFNGTNPNQGLYIYSPTGQLLCQYSLTGYPSVGAGGGFAIVNNVVYVHNNSSFTAGNIVPGSTNINFTVQAGITSPSDFASCPIPLSVPALIVAPSGGTLNCTSPTVNLVVSSTVTPLTYTWTGPGIVSGTNSATLTVNQPGVYTASVTQSGCPPKRVTLTFSVTGNASGIFPTIAASNSLSCLNPTSLLSVTPNSATNTIVWTGPGIVSGSGTPSITVNAPGIYSVSLTNTVNACVGTNTFNLGTINLVNTPTIVTSNTLTCLTPSAQLSVIPASATNIATWAGPSIVSGNGSYSVQVNVSGIYSVVISNSVNTCTSSASYSLGSTIAPLTVTVSPNTSKCANAPALNLSALGAANYNWAPSVGLSSTSGNAVTANPPSTTTYTVIGTTGVCTGTGFVTVSVTPVPVLSIVASSNSVCALSSNNSPVTTTLSASGATTYSWSSIFNMTGCGPANSATVCLTPVAPNNLPGPQNVTLVGFNGVCSSTLSTSVNIIPNPVIGVTPPTPSICLGNTIALTANGASTYQWSPGFGLSSTVGSSVSAGPSVNTVYSIVGSAFGCNSSTTVSLSVVQPPVVTAAVSSPTVCAGGNVNLTANGASTYLWIPATNLSSNTGANVTANPQVSSTYSVIGTSNTCTHIAVVSISVIANPVLNIIATRTLFCAGLSSEISVNGANSYSWSPSTFLNASNTNYVVSTPTAPINYMVTGFNGICTGSTNVFLDIVPVPNVAFSMSQNQICQGQTAFFGASGATTYSWAPNIALSSVVGNSVAASPLGSTTYSVFGYNTSGNVSCGDYKVIQLNVVPVPNAIIGNSVALCKGQSGNVSVNGGDTYYWTPTPTVSNPTKASTKVTPSVSTVYSVEVSTQSLCPVTRTVLVVVNPLPIVNAGADTTFNLDEPMSLKAIGTGTLTWIDGEEIWCKVCPSTPIYPKNSGCYTIEAENQFGCKVRDVVCIEVTTEYGLYIPNAFTPNGDGNNEMFLVQGWGLLSVNLEIFDQWGTLLFSSNDQAKGWDGVYKGVNVKNDVYVYKATVKVLSGKVITKTGHISVLR